MWPTKVFGQLISSTPMAPHGAGKCPKRPTCDMTGIGTDTPLLRLDEGDELRKHRRDTYPKCYGLLTAHHGANTYCATTRILRLAPHGVRASRHGAVVPAVPRGTLRTLTDTGWGLTVFAHYPKGNLSPELWHRPQVTTKHHAGQRPSLRLPGLASCTLQPEAAKP